MPIVFVIKYVAANKGAIIKQELREGSTPGRLYDRYYNGFNIGSEAFHSEDEAQKAARELIQKKIASYQRSIEALGIKLARKLPIEDRT